MAAALQGWDAARAAVADLPLDGLSGAELLALYEGRVCARRRDAAVDHIVLAHLREQFRPEDHGNTGLRDVLAQRLHMDAGDVRRRLAAAEVLGGAGPAVHVHR